MKINKVTMAKINLLFYSLKYSWVKDMVSMNDIDLNFGLSNKCSEVEIEDYINVIKKGNRNSKIQALKNQLVKEEESLMKAQIAQRIAKLKSGDLN